MAFAQFFASLFRARQEAKDAFGREAAPRRVGQGEIRQELGEY